MNHLLSFLFLMTSLVSWSQTEFAPNGAIWNYTANELPYRDRTVQVIHDTIIGGNPVKTLQSRTFTGIGPFNDSSTYIYPLGKIELRADSVIYYPNTSFPNNGRYLFGFNMQVGDTITIETDPGFEYIAVVDTVYTIVVDGFTLKKWELSRYCDSAFFGTANVVENIGLIDDLLPWDTNPCSYMSWYAKFHFQCYGSSSLNYNAPCTPLVASTVEADNIQLDVFPNPVSGKELTLRSSVELMNVKLCITDIFGKLIYEIWMDELSEMKLKLPFLEAGNYLIELKTEKGSVRKKFVKLD